LEQIKKVFLTANTAKKTFLGYNKYKKRDLLEILLWNLEIENKKIANIKFKMPYRESWFVTSSFCFKVS
jgi:hypothetical protein